MRAVKALPPLGNVLFCTVRVQQSGKAGLAPRPPYLRIGDLLPDTVPKLHNPPLFAQPGVLGEAPIFRLRQLPQNAGKKSGGLLGQGAELVRGILYGQFDGFIRHSISSSAH